MIYLQYIKTFGGNVETLYDILEVSRKASKEVIEKAYKTLAKKYHPDLQTAENKEIAEKRMKEINEAYDVLSDEQKRKEYDEKLEAEDERKKQEEYINYQSNSGTQNVRYESNMQTSDSDNSGNYSNPNNYSNQDFDWRKAYANLSKKEQHKIMKEVQKEANAEYRKQYEDYFRSLGFKIKHKWTFKDFLTVILVIGALAIIVGVLWLIPPTHEYMLNLYNTNLIVRIFTDVVIGIFQGFVRFFQNFTKF
jgi:chaperone protein DnaJ